MPSVCDYDPLAALERQIIGRASVPKFGCGLLRRGLERAASRTFSLRFRLRPNVMGEALGSFEQAVLVCVAQLRSDAYGRAVLHEVARRLDRKVPSGAVYITLERLEEQGLISSRWVTSRPSGRARRYYIVEAAGMQALSKAKAVIDSLWEGFPFQCTHGED